MATLACNRFHILKRISLSTLACLLLLVSVSQTAFAAPLHGTGDPNGKSPNVYGCLPGGSYTSVSRTGSRFYGVTVVYHNYNGTSQYEDMTFTATTSGTVGVSVSVSATVDANAIVAGAQGTTSATLYGYLTTAVGNSTTVKNVPPYTNVYAQYGVWTEATTGHYTYTNNYCATTNYGTITAWVPDGIGWYTHN